MLSSIFGKKVKETKRSFHCEVTGKETTLENTIGLVKIDGIIALKNLKNPIVNIEEQIIYSDGKEPIEFYSELLVPDDLKDFFGRIFSVIDDLDDAEYSTGIMSEEGRKIFSGKGLFKFGPYIQKGYEAIRIPNTMFLAVIDENTKFKNSECSNWNLNYKSSGSKYRFKKILNEKKNRLTYGSPSFLFSGFDIGISDCSEKNPNGNGYQFTTEKSFQKINLCSNWITRTKLCQ